MPTVQVGELGDSFVKTTPPRVNNESDSRERKVCSLPAVYVSGKKYLPREQVSSILQHRVLYRCPAKFSVVLH